MSDVKIRNLPLMTKYKFLVGVKIDPGREFPIGSKLPRFRNMKVESLEEGKRTRYLGRYTKVFPYIFNLNFKRPKHGKPETIKAKLSTDVRHPDGEWERIEKEFLLVIPLGYLDDPFEKERDRKLEEYLAGNRYI